MEQAVSVRKEKASITYLKEEKARERIEPLLTLRINSQYSSHDIVRFNARSRSGAKQRVV